MPHVAQAEALVLNARARLPLHLLVAGAARAHASRFAEHLLHELHRDSPLAPQDLRQGAFTVRG